MTPTTPANDDENENDLVQTIKETLEAIRREGKELGLTDEDLQKEEMSFLLEQYKQTVSIFTNILRAVRKNPHIDDETKLEINEEYCAILESLQRTKHKVKRVKQQLLEEKRKERTRKQEEQ